MTVLTSNDMYNTDPLVYDTFYNELSASWSSAMWTNVNREWAVYASSTNINLAWHWAPHVNWWFFWDDNTQQTYWTTAWYPMMVWSYCRVKSLADVDWSCWLTHRLNLMFIR